MISHLYGAHGAEPKTVDTKSIILDFELVQEFSNPHFTATVKNSVDQFIQALKDSQSHSGKQ